MGSDTDKRNAEEPFRNGFGNLQRIKLLPFLFPQNTLHGRSQSSWPVTTQDSDLELAGQVEKVPIRALNSSRQCIAIEVLDDSPTRQESFTLDRQAYRQERALSDEDGSRHFGS
jgi:hypothetical protein